MNVYEVLTKDHESVMETLDKLEKQASNNDSDAKDTFQHVKKVLTEHAHAEEQYFYPIIADKAGAAELIDRAKSQHQTISSILMQMENVVNFDLQSLNAQLVDLRNTVKDHVSFEETEIFSRARSIFDKDQADQIGDEVLKAEPTGHPIRSRVADIAS